jgi:hypothetical protein
VFPVVILILPAVIVITVPFLMILTVGKVRDAVTTDSVAITVLIV